MPAHQELPEDDPTTSGPDDAGDGDHHRGDGRAEHAVCAAHFPAQWWNREPALGVWRARESPGHCGSTDPHGGDVRGRHQPASVGAAWYGGGRCLPAPRTPGRPRPREHGGTGHHPAVAAVAGGRGAGELHHGLARRVRDRVARRGGARRLGRARRVLRPRGAGALGSRGSPPSTTPGGRVGSSWSSWQPTPQTPWSARSRWGSANGARPGCWPCGSLRRSSRPGGGVDRLRHPWARRALAALRDPCLGTSRVAEPTPLAMREEAGPRRGIPEHHPLAYPGCSVCAAPRDAGPPWDVLGQFVGLARPQSHHGGLDRAAARAAPGRVVPEEPTPKASAYVSTLTRGHRAMTGALA